MSNFDNSYIKTPSQVEGPFYPVTHKTCEDNRLNHALGDLSGNKIIVAGHVMDSHGRPLRGILVEIWQADEQGRYDHPGDTQSGKPINQDFQYWGKTVTDQQGRYVFHTIKPAPYNDDGEWRTPHIHFKLYQARHNCILTTQLYFAGEALNAQDNHLSSLSSDEQQCLLSNPSMLGEKYGLPTDTEIHEFNIVV